MDSDAYAQFQGSSKLSGVPTPPSVNQSSNEAETPASPTAAIDNVPAVPPSEVPAVPDVPAPEEMPSPPRGGFFSGFFGSNENEEEASPVAETTSPAPAVATAEPAKVEEPVVKKEEPKKKEVAGPKQPDFIPIPKRKPYRTYSSQNLPRTISKRHYSPENSHLPPAAYIEEHVHLLFNAIAQGNLPVVRSLVEKYKGVDVRDREGNTPLLYATALGDVQVVTMLLGMYADPNVHNVYLTTPLHAAAAGGRTDLTTLLLKAGALVDEQDQTGMTPLMVAAERGFGGVVDLLLNADAKISIRRKDGNTVLHLACITPNPETCYTLLRRGANTEYRNFEGLTPLMLAAKLGNVKTVALLLKAGADTEATDASGRNAAHLATSSGYDQLAMVIASEAVRRQELADKMEEIRTYGRYQPPPDPVESRNYETQAATSIVARRKNGIPLPVAKPDMSATRSASIPQPMQEGTGYLPMYKAPIPRYLPQTPTYYGSSQLPKMPHPENTNNFPLSGDAPPPQTAVPSQIPAYNNAPSPQPPSQSMPDSSLDSRDFSPGGREPSRMLRYF